MKPDDLNAAARYVDEFYIGVRVQQEVKTAAVTELIKEAAYHL